MNTLVELLSSRVKAEIFRLLFGVASRESHVREIERQSGPRCYCASGTQASFDDGRHRIELDGNRRYYRANKHHPLYPDIRSMVLKTSELVEWLREALVCPDVRLAFVFGSVAAGTETAESDIVLIVIGSLSFRQLSGLSLRE